MPMSRMLFSSTEPQTLIIAGASAMGGSPQILYLMLYLQSTAAAASRNARRL